MQIQTNHYVTNYGGIQKQYNVSNSRVTQNTSFKGTGHKLIDISELKKLNVFKNLTEKVENLLIEEGFHQIPYCKMSGSTTEFAYNGSRGCPNIKMLTDRNSISRLILDYDGRSLGHYIKEVDLSQQEPIIVEKLYNPCICLTRKNHSHIVDGKKVNDLEFFGGFDKHKEINTYDLKDTFQIDLNAEPALHPIIDEMMYEAGRYGKMFFGAEFTKKLRLQQEIASKRYW